ncbi:hypothetical protein [Aestuariivirga sp.]|uniref:hypothetical protein n=1 Tax=Aestuariivirga sp. TaxID=2650926 RepID=UPI003BA9954A
MKIPKPAQTSELQLALGAQHTEVLRSFVREVALADGIPASSAGLLATDCAVTWEALCTIEEVKERVHVSLRVLHDAVRARLLLRGHKRFAQAINSLEGRLPRGAGVSCHESGIDSWEILLHRSLIAPRDMLPPDPAPAIGTSPVAAGIGNIAIDLADKADALGIARCFLAVYGHHYVHSEVFSPRHYWARVEAGELIPVVARSPDGEVIGHVALERLTGALVAERGEAVVLPAFRGYHLLERMTDRLSEEAPKHGLQGVYAEPLTIHTFSQRNDVHAGMPVCAVLLGANPENFRPKDIACPTAGQRQSYLRTFRFVQAAPPRSLQDTGPYADLLSQIYASLGVKVAAPEQSMPAPVQSKTRIGVNDRGYGVIRFDAIGNNCAVELAQALADVRSLGARSVQLSCRIGSSGLSSFINSARALGFFFCGLGPSFAEGEDLLLLQLLTEPLDTSKLQLFTDEAKALVAFIESDRNAVSARTG